jgi:hypothetical protein
MFDIGVCAYLRGLILLNNEELGQVSVDSERDVSGWKLSNSGQPPFAFNEIIWHK